MKLGALVALALGLGAELSKVLRSLGHDVIVELELDPTGLICPMIRMV